MTPRTEAAAVGSIGGAMAAGAMSALRMAAHRSGMIERQVPQVFEAWLERRAGLSLSPVPREFLTHVLHVGYGAAWGAVYGLLFGTGRRATLRRGVPFGLFQWGLGFFALAPLMGAARSPLRSEARENAVNAGAHLLYGVLLALITEELARQPSSRQFPHTRRVG